MCFFESSFIIDLDHSPFVSIRVNSSASCYWWIFRFHVRERPESSAHKFCLVILIYPLTKRISFFSRSENWNHRHFGFWVSMIDQEVDSPMEKAHIGRLTLIIIVIIESCVFKGLKEKTINQFSFIFCFEESFHTKFFHFQLEWSLLRKIIIFLDVRRPSEGRMQLQILRVSRVMMDESIVELLKRRQYAFLRFTLHIFLVSSPTNQSWLFILEFIN